MPAFDISKLEVPAAFRDVAEKNIAQAREGFDKLKIAAEETAETLEQTLTTAAKGLSEYNLKLVEALRVNANALFDLYASLVGVKSISEIVEVSTAHARQQFDVVTAQAKDLSTLAQKLAADASEPIKNNVFKVKKAA